MLILASASPRRHELLSLLGFEFKVVPAHGEEIITEAEPEKAVISLASQKAAEVYSQNKSATIIAADTIVYSNGRFLGKPKNAEDARSMLKELSGRKHSVFTGVCIISEENKYTFSEQTEVEFFSLSDSEIEDYIASGEPFDKAGAYGIQGLGSLLVKGIVGDYYNVMGLPVGRVYRILKKLENI